MSLDYEQIKQEVKEEIMQSLSTRFNHEKERKLTNYRQQNAYVQKGRTLFTQRHRRGDRGSGTEWHAG